MSPTRSKTSGWLQNSAKLDNEEIHYPNRYAVLCLNVAGTAFSSFSNDPDKTVEEMKVYLSTVNKDRQKDADALLEEFTKYWTTSIDGESQMAFLRRPISC